MIHAAASEEQNAYYDYKFYTISPHFPETISIASGVCLFHRRKCASTETTMNAYNIHFPTTFQLSMSGFRPHISVWLEGSELHYYAAGETSAQKTVRPSSEQWLHFWNKCEELDIWSWNLEYILDRWEEGYRWGVDIEYAGRRIRACGISMYPGKIDLTAPPDHESPITIQVDTWNSFTHAVEELLGGLPFMWSDWRPYDFPTHDQTIRNELGNDMKNLPAEPRDGIQADLGISIVDLDLGWFQMRIDLPNLCVFADTDDTMTPGALSDLNHALDVLSAGAETIFIDFDNEHLDTARIIMTSDRDGMTRLTIMDWCEEDIPPRLDIKAPTPTVVCRLREAVSNYAAATDGKLVDLFPVCDDL